MAWWEASLVPVGDDGYVIKNRCLFIYDENFLLAPLDEVMSNKLSFNSTLTNQQTCKFYVLLLSFNCVKCVSSNYAKDFITTIPNELARTTVFSRRHFSLSDNPTLPH